MEGSTRTLPGITLIVLALFLLANHAARGASSSEWALALLLGIVGFVLLISNWLEARFRSGQKDEPRITQPPPVVYAAPSAPVLPAAPSPTAEKYVEPLPFDAVPVSRSAQDHDVVISAPMQEALLNADVSNPPVIAAVPAPEDNLAVVEDVVVSNAVQETPVVSGKPDDLTVIEGIGPKMSAALVSAGIDTFDKLWKASEESIRAAIQAAGMRFAPTVPTWAEQASYAANGDWDGLKAFQETLKSGRKV